MPTGKTEKGQEADGSIILIYYQDKFLMGEETNYATDNRELKRTYRTNTGLTADEAFLSPGTTDNDEDTENAKIKFASNANNSQIRLAHNGTK